MTPHLYLSIMPFWENDVGCKPQLQQGIKLMNRVVDWLPETTVTVNVSARLQSVQYSPDGTRIVSGSHDKTLRIWDARTGTQIGVPLQGHDDRVSSVAFSPDGTRIVSGSHDKTLRIWDARAGTQIGVPLQGHDGWLNSVAESLPDSIPHDGGTNNPPPTPPHPSMPSPSDDYGKKKAEEAAKKKVEEEAARRTAAEEQQQQEAAEKRRRLAAAAAARSRRGPPSSEATTSARQVEVKVPRLVKKGKAPTRNEVSGGDPDNGDDGKDDDDKDEEKEPCEQCKAKKIPCLQQAGKRSSIILKKEVTSNPTSERLAVLESQVAQLLADNRVLREGQIRANTYNRHMMKKLDWLMRDAVRRREGSPEEPIPGPSVLPKKRRQLVDSEEEREKEREQEEVRGDEDEPEPKKARSEKGKERED
ncbi:MAG: hypothetical protein NXY57DRAFT_1068057 [Lentinula lateritia]|nr:MAG: hypothetical protein NXY57DRAFT_1068057 [Lentinula lateritia]